MRICLFQFYGIAKMLKRSCILCPFISYLSFLFKYLYVDNRITMYCLNIFLILFFAITITKILNKTLLCPKTIPINLYHIYYSINFNMPICFTYFVEISKILFQFQTHVALNDHNLSLYISIPILVLTSLSLFASSLQFHHIIL